MALRKKSTLRAVPVFKMVLIIVFAGVLGVFRNFVLPGGIDFGTSGAQHATAQDTLSENLTLEQGYVLYQQGVQFLDARSHEKFQAARIPGAINIPAELTFQEKVERTDSLDISAKYILYCNDAECPLADELYEFLQIAGFQDIHIMVPGFDGWQKAGYPVEGESDAE